MGPFSSCRGHPSFGRRGMVLPVFPGMVTKEIVKSVRYEAGVAYQVSRFVDRHERQDQTGHDHKCSASASESGSALWLVLRDHKPAIALLVVVVEGAELWERSRAFVKDGCVRSKRQPPAFSLRPDAI